MSFKYFFQQNKIKFNNNFNFIPNNNKFLNKSQLKIIKIIKILEIMKIINKVILIQNA